MRFSSRSKSLLAPVSRLSVLRISFIEKLMHLLVRGLREVFVPEPDRLERLGRAETNDVDAFVAEFVAGLLRGDGDGDDDVARLHFLERGDGGAHRRAGR